MSIEEEKPFTELEDITTMLENFVAENPQITTAICAVKEHGGWSVFSYVGNPLQAHGLAKDMYESHIEHELGKLEGENDGD